MAVIYDDYLWSGETFNQTDDFDGNGRLVPIPLIPSSVSGYSFIGDNDTLITLTFQSSGSVKISLNNYVYYKSTSLNDGDTGAYNVIGGSAVNNTGYFEIYNAGTNTLVASKSFTLPGPNESSEIISLSVSSAGTYDLKIKCQNSYVFADMYDANNTLTLTHGVVDSIFSEWDLQLRAVDSTSIETNYVEGYLYDEIGEGLPGIGICLKENPSIGVSTDLDGHYKLGPISGSLFNIGTLVVVGVIGYKTLEFPINGRRRVDIHLELEEDDPSPDLPIPSVPDLPKDKIVTVQDIVDFLDTDIVKRLFYNIAVNNFGYAANRCMPRYILDEIVTTHSFAISYPKPDLNTKYKLIKSSEISKQSSSLRTMVVADLERMIDFYEETTDYSWYIESYHGSNLNGGLYPTADLVYETSNTITGTQEQWESLYNKIYDDEAESSQIRLTTGEGHYMVVSRSFYDALYELAFGTSTQQTVYISPLYTLTVQDWDEFAENQIKFDWTWVFAVDGMEGPFLDGGDYPTSNLYYYEGISRNTITGYIWQWQNLIDYIDYYKDGEWEYLGLAVPDEEWTDSYNYSNVMIAIQDIVNEENDQVTNFCDTPVVTGTFNISPTSVSLSDSAQLYTVDVTNTTGKTYTVSSNVSWITVSNNYPTLSISANTSTASRYGTVTFTCNGVSKTISVAQNGTPSMYSIPIYYVCKGWFEEESFEIDARISGSFSGGNSMTICTNLAIVDGYGHSGNGDRKEIINTFNISKSSISSTYLNFWGSVVGSEGRVYLVKVSEDGSREIVSPIWYLSEFDSTSASPRIRVLLSTYERGDSYELWFEQGDNVSGIYGL